MLNKDKVKQIADLCIVQGKSVKEVMLITGMEQSRVSEIKNSNAGHIVAIDILCEKNKPLLKRITRKKIRSAVAMHVDRRLTCAEIDEELDLKPGSCLMLTRSPIWKAEKFRLTRYGKLKE